MHTPSCRTSPFSRRAHPRPCAQLPHVLQPLHRAHPWPRVGTCHTPRGRTAAASPRQVGVCHRAGAPRLAQAAAGQLSPDRRSAAGSRNEAGGHDQPLSRRQRTAGGGGQAKETLGPKRTLAKVWRRPRRKAHQQRKGAAAATQRDCGTRGRMAEGGRPLGQRMRIHGGRRKQASHRRKTATTPAGERMANPADVGGGRPAQGPEWGIQPTTRPPTAEGASRDSNARGPTAGSRS